MYDLVTSDGNRTENSLINSWKISLEDLCGSDNNNKILRLIFRHEFIINKIGREFWIHDVYSIQGGHSGLKSADALKYKSSSKLLEVFRKYFKSRQSVLLRPRNPWNQNKSCVRNTNDCIHIQTIFHFNNLVKDLQIKLIFWI